MVFLDHAATTDLRPEARDAWLNAAAVAGNPASLHARGRVARRIVEESREHIGEALGVPPAAVVFTSGGTESDNIAISGSLADDRSIAVPGTEHKAVLEPAEGLGPDRVRWLEVDSEGRLDAAEVKDLLADDPRIGLVTAMAVNNETGVIHPIAELAAVCRETGVPLHVDAVQALGVVDVDLSGVTTSAFSAHKVGGPMGVGLLTVAPGATVRPLVRGGGHEGGLRAGTVNVPGIAATAVAVELAVNERDRHHRHLAALRDRLLAGLAADGSLGARVNSPADAAPGIVNVSFPGCESDALMLLLDAAGIAVSTGSACTVGIPRPSHVLVAMGRDPVDARSALRVSFGRTSTADDVAALLRALPEAVARARRAAAAGRRTVG